MANKRWMAKPKTAPKASSRRQEILQAAGDLFSQKGYHATSMRDLAKAVRLEGGSLYAHIESKEELLFEIVNQAADAFTQMAEQIPEHLPLEERFRLLVLGHLQVIVRQLPHATVFFHEWKFLSSVLQERILQRRDKYESYFRKLIQQGIEAKTFKVEDPSIAAVFMLSALNWTYHWYRPGGPLSLEQLAQQYHTLLWHSMLPK